MIKPAAKVGDRVVGVDTHIELIASPAGPVPTPLPHAFDGTIGSGSPTVLLDDQAAARRGDSVMAAAPHLPQAGSFMKPPHNTGEITQCSAANVWVDDLPIAIAGDVVTTCNDPADAPTSHVLIGGPGANVFVGGGDPE